MWEEKTFEMKKIIIKNAHENNLKNIDVEIPLNSFNCITGCSGCGKSSLVFDTIYAESQRSFLEGMSGNIYGQKLMSKPKVGSIENLRPALNISQNYYNVNPRSTVGTITEISYYLRALFSLINTTEFNYIAENLFSPNNPKSCCPNCSGLGIEMTVSKDLLIPDKEKTLLEGGILFFKGTADGKEQKTLEALCKYYGIDITKKICDLTEKEMQILLYSDDKVKEKITYKEGKRRKTHFVFLQGAITSIYEKLKNSSNTLEPTAYSKYMKENTCSMCNGKKLKPEILNYKLNDFDYSQIENMELRDVYDFFGNYKYDNIEISKRELVSELVESIKSKLKPLLDLNVGYLSLDRSIPSLSGGERQRVRFATQLTCSLQGLLYILDEPCKGLHYNDVSNIIVATQNLIKKGNTVIAIEHNKKFISSADNVIELGPIGGPDGGYLINSKIKNPQPIKGISFKNVDKLEKYAQINNISFRNINNQSVEFPINGISCITGVSGSGKSNLARVIMSNINQKNDYYCESKKNFSYFKKVIHVNQSPIGKTPRSTIVSYLEIFDEIRLIFSKISEAKLKKIPASFFSMNVKGGRCECCQGTGLKKIELNYLPSSYIKCPECDGKRFNEEILSIRYKGKNILDVLEAPIQDISKIFKENKKIYPILNSMIALGLGYLKLGQMSMNISGGEAQRIKLAKALGKPSKGRNLYILDEPTSGLNDIDIKKFKNLLMKLKENKETILIIEHNIDFIVAIADYIIDFGVCAGSKGGKIVSQGLPKIVFEDSKSSLYGLQNHI